MKALQALVVATALAGCASVPVTEVPRQLFADAAFAPPTIPPTVADVFTLTDEMRQFADRELRRAIARNGTHFGMFQTLRNDLRLDYDAADTRNAEQAYAARAGNCLSLVILTASFAKYLDVPVYYQHVIGENAWSRAAGIAFMSGHVNLKIGYRDSQQTLGRPFDGVTIDFLAPSAAARFSTRLISEETLLAMYLNNRAAEALVDGRIDDAYWWSRAAIEQAPTYQSATNTLGVIYQRHGNRREAERAFHYVLEREPANANAMTNLVGLLKRDGRMAEAADWHRKLVALEPYPPFYFLDRGLAALEQGDADAALALFERELQRLPYNDEVHFAIATADLRRGQLRDAAKHLAFAEKYSMTRDRRDIYVAKLARLKAISPESAGAQ